MNKNKKTTTEEKFPMRINQYLAKQQTSTRRGADTLITRGFVYINGTQAKLGALVNEGDTVEIKNHKAPERLYIAYYKPKGIVTSTPKRHEKGINDIFHFRPRVSPIGRLDKDSHGLIIMTNDGRITDRLLNPEYEHEKEYIVKVERVLSPDFVEKMEQGVVIDGYKTKPCTVKKVNDKEYRITLTEGKNRQIRKMTEALDNRVVDLKRMRILNVRIGNMRPGMHRKLEGAELELFLKKLRMKK